MNDTQLYESDPPPSYTLRRSSRRRRTIELSIHATLGLVVAAPARATQHEIDAFVRRKERWIRRALKEAHTRTLHHQRRFVSGESLPYLGGTLELIVLEAQDGTRSHVERAGDRLRVELPQTASASGRRAAAIAVIERWYKDRAQEVLSERVRHFAPLAGVTPTGLVVRDQKTRWGSCGKHGTLYFNWRLMLAPMAVLDYLVVHELCHLRQRGHGRRFWRLVASAMPDFEEREAMLRRDGWRYRLY